jgi:hypothetical protein
VTDGFGIACITASDGMYFQRVSPSFVCVLVCRRKTDVVEMYRLSAVHGHVVAEKPNEEFVAEILRAAGDLYALCLPGKIPKSRLIILSINSEAERDTNWNYMRTSGAVIRRNQNARDNFLFFFFGNLELNILLTGRTSVIYN